MFENKEVRDALGVFLLKSYTRAPSGSPVEEELFAG